MISVLKLTTLQIHFRQRVPRKAACDALVLKCTYPSSYIHIYSVFR